MTVRSAAPALGKVASTIELSPGSGGLAAPPVAGFALVSDSLRARSLRPAPPGLAALSEGDFIIVPLSHLRRFSFL
jgi:hypothetical protein